MRLYDMVAVTVEEQECTRILCGNPGPSLSIGSLLAKGRVPPAAPMMTRERQAQSKSHDFERIVRVEPWRAYRHDT